MIAVIDGDPILYVAMWGCKTLNQAKRKLDKTLVEQYLEPVFTDDYVMAVGSSTNYRSDIYPMYKKSKGRVNSNKKKPGWFNELREYLRSKPNTVTCVGYEADDQVRIWCGELAAAGKEHICISIDKDLDCIPGLHFNPNIRVPQEIYRIASKETGTAFFWQQMLQGDGIDNIPGVPGVGPVGAKKLLADCKTNDERRDIVFQTYYNKFGDDAFSQLLSNGKMLHIWETMNDHFTIEKETYNIAIRALGV